MREEDFDPPAEPLKHDIYTCGKQSRAPVGRTSCEPNGPSTSTASVRVDPGVTVTNFFQLTNSGPQPNGAFLHNAGTMANAVVTTTGNVTITNEQTGTITSQNLIGIQAFPFVAEAVGIGVAGGGGFGDPVSVNNSGTISGTIGI